MFNVSCDYGKSPYCTKSHTYRANPKMSPQAVLKTNFLMGSGHDATYD